SEPDAHRFGAIFSSLRCKNSQPVVLKFELDIEAAGLRAIEVLRDDADKQVRKDLKDLGKTIQEDLREQQHLQTTQRPVVPTQDQIDQMICRNVLTREQEQTYDNFKMADVISGAPPHLKLNRELMEFAQKNFYITPIKEPFQQVVLVTNKAMQALKFQGQMDIEDSVADVGTWQAWEQFCKKDPQCKKLLG
ncbi:hypothetical protein C8J57DRAFT_1325569, partial [Mycena rebaudengoi]